MTPNQEALKRSFAAALASVSADRIGVAVSGGSDSLALLHLVAECWPQGRVFAATVDHGLRAEAKQEAEIVAEHCRKLGVPHEILNWREWDGSGNLQSSARTARYQLLAGWARTNDVEAVLLGHTKDDQAETILMRLGRAAGVDGLCAMEPKISRYGMVFQRPLLFVRRAELQSLLRNEGHEWVSDPSNDDAAYHRVELRQAMPKLAALGLTVDALSAVATHMQSVRKTLDHNTQKAAVALCDTRHGDVFIDRNGLLFLDEETRRRLLVHALCWVSGATYPPRQISVEQVFDALTSGRDTTLHGCLVRTKGDSVSICREYQTVKNIEVPFGSPWDKRWIILGPKLSGAMIGALGEKGLRSCPEWRETGHARKSLLASPAVWANGTLIAAPLAGFNQEYRAELIYSSDHFHSSVLSH